MSCKNGVGATYEFLGLSTVLDLDDWLPTTVYHSEGEVLKIRLNLCICKLATNKTLGIEYSVPWVHSDLILCSITDETLRVGESDIRGSCAVTLVVGDDFNTIVLPYTDTSEDDEFKRDVSVDICVFRLTSKLYPSRCRLLLKKT